jgi:peptidoglycan/xylan/chitin deacetylase (PgdA/CDA1 family)
MVVRFGRVGRRGARFGGTPEGRRIPGRRAAGLLAAVACLAAAAAGCGTAASAPGIGMPAVRTAAAPAAPTPPQASASGGAEPAPAPSVPPGPFTPNQMGEIPILEFHNFFATDGRWAITIPEFRALLGNLYRHGFRPVDFRDVVNRSIDLPRGYAPVVLTFDDGDPSQFQWAPAAAGGGRRVPAADTAVGVMWRFHQSHPDWALRGSFYVNRNPWGSDSVAKVRWLVAHGFEVGDHTLDHVDLTGHTAAWVEHQVGGVAAFVQQAAPGYRVETFAYPYGEGNHLPSTAWRGVYHGQPYHIAAALLVGANPAPSPYSKQWHPLAVPRIQVVNPDQVQASTLPWIWGGPKGWEAQLLAHPNRLYASSGSPHTLAVPSADRAELSSALHLTGVQIVP